MEEKSLVAAQQAGLVSVGSMKEKIAALYDPNRKGFEEQPQPGDLPIPRARLLQGSSEEVKTNGRVFYAGMIINSITKDPITETFIPIKRLPNNWIRFNARKTEDPNYVPGVGDGDIVWRSDDPKDPRVKEQTKFGPKGEAPAATTFMNFLCYFEGFTLPIVLSFSKTSYEMGRRFYFMALEAGGEMYSHKYKLASKQQAKGSNTFHVLEVTKAGKCSAEEMEIGKIVYDRFQAAELKVHEEEFNEPGSDS